jgi:hypothetical protein
MGDALAQHLPSQFIVLEIQGTFETHQTLFSWLRRLFHF